MLYNCRQYPVNKVNFKEIFVYKIPYRRARAWPSGLGRVRARAKESYIQKKYKLSGKSSSDIEIDNSQILIK